MAAAVAAGLDVHPVAITRDGEWRTATGAAALLGADPDALDHLARALATTGDDLAATRKRLDRPIHSTPWNGRNADRILVMSSRPGLIRADIRNDFERPRSAVRARPEYAARIDEIWGLIRSDALHAISSKEH